MTQADAPFAPRLLARVFRPERFTGWHMAAIMGLFFGTIIAVNITLAVFAGASWSGLVVKNSYVASQNFDANTAAQRRQDARGWRVEPDYRDGIFAVRLDDAAGAAITGAAVTATIGRPTHARDDTTARLAPAADGTYTTAIALAGGHWQARVAIAGPGGEPWTKTFRLTVAPQSGP